MSSYSIESQVALRFIVHEISMLPEAYKNAKYSFANKVELSFSSLRMIFTTFFNGLLIYK